MPCAAQAFLVEPFNVNDRGCDLELYQCDACGLLQLKGAPVSYYREVIRSAAYSPEMRAFREAQFADWSQRYGLAGRRVVEIGCGRGEYLLLLKEAGLDACGIEAGTASLRACRAAGLRATRGYLTRRSGMLPGAPFDAFVSFNFLEHWPDPVGSLRALVRNLTDGGVGLVEVPNFDMILRQGLFSEFIADHLLYFTEDTLCFVLRRAGFDVLTCRVVWHNYILSAEVRKRAPLNIDRLEQRRTAITSALHAFIGHFPLGKVAIWGAGHQALAVIALAGIAPDIRYIIDSAPFKQGRYSPATHLRIVAPDILWSEPVQAVIVMAASYSEEVAKILRCRFSAELVVAVLRDDGLELA